MCWLIADWTKSLRIVPDTAGDLRIQPHPGIFARSHAGALSCVLHQLPTPSVGFVEEGEISSTMRKSATTATFAAIPAKPVATATATAEQLERHHTAAGDRDVQQSEILEDIHPRGR